MNPSAASIPRSAAAFLATRAAEWRPGLVAAAVPHGEVFASAREATGAALALALETDRGRTQAHGDGRSAAVGDQRAWLWVQDAAALRLGGRPYGPGLPPSLRHRLIHVAARKAEDALFALEEGLRCRDLAFVLGEVAGNPRTLSLTASRRLSLAVERHGVPLWLVRLDAARDLGSARLRWEARAAASTPVRSDPRAPGQATWQAELFRARSHPPGAWTLWEEQGEAGLQARRAAPAQNPPAQNPHAEDTAAEDTAGARGA